MITAENVTKWFGPILAVDDVSFRVERGEVLGFLGPNGAGKSTTMRVVTGFLPASGGTVNVGGFDIDDEPLQAKALIGYLPENAPAYPEMTVEGFLRFTAEVRGFRGAAKAEAVERAIRTCFLERVRHQVVETLSKGYLHRTCFAQAILHDPPVLVLDEPTDGLDPNQKHEMRELIKEMGKEKAIIVSTHILEEVEAICTRLIIVDRGKLIFNGSPDELRSKATNAGSLCVRVSGAEEAEVVAKLKDAAGVKKVDVIPNGEGVCCRITGKADPSTMAQVILGAGWKLDKLAVDAGRMDDVFREITIPDTVAEDAE
ncbi:MAG: ABC transporter ATP-binding protein [Victivallales bacterium]|nr:ABC transporter ATP-binding protein [Victivallales bacterium]